MKSVFVLAAVAFALSMTIAPTHAFAAKSSSKKSEPAPKDRDERTGGEEKPDPREETYEGNDRSRGGTFDGGGYEGGSEEGGFYAISYKTWPKKGNVRVEDRGTVLVMTETIPMDPRGAQVCSQVIRTVVQKVSGEVLKKESQVICQDLSI